MLVVTVIGPQPASFRPFIDLLREGLRGAAARQRHVVLVDWDQLTRSHTLGKSERRVGETGMTAIRRYSTYLSDGHHPVRAHLRAFVRVMSRVAVYWNDVVSQCGDSAGAQRTFTTTAELRRYFE